MIDIAASCGAAQWAASVAVVAVKDEAGPHRAEQCGGAEAEAQRHGAQAQPRPVNNALISYA